MDEAERDWWHDALAAANAERDEALDLLRELVAGADDHRCWWIPSEIADDVRALVERVDREKR